MHLLIIGGTIFLGRHLVLQALAAGHKVTTLNRGTISLDEQAGVEKLIDDRTKDLDVLYGRAFDAVIDTCGYDEQVVNHSLEALAGKVGTYVFISTISVYGEYKKPGLNESDPIDYSSPLVTPDPSKMYGQKKSDCERIVHKRMGDRALIVRPGVIVGPYDPTDRFTYWAARIARGGEVLVPSTPDRHVQFIDVRDLSKWIIESVEKKLNGVYNATGPQTKLTMGEFVDQCKQSTQSNATFTWVSDSFLEIEKVQPFVDLPFWIPRGSKEYEYFQQIDCNKAFQSGLKISALDNTIKATLAWDKERPEGKRSAGLTPELEHSLLSKLKP